MPRATSTAAFALVVVLNAGTAGGEERARPAPPIGETVGMPELMRFFAVAPSGSGLPAGRGDAKTGREVYEAKCAMCHGHKLEGIASTGAPALAGGRGTLGAVPAKKTVESYWPYATTLFDYIKRAMPFTQPGSLSDDEVYALCAYILAQDKIVAEDAVLDKASLPRVQMPNRHGFVPYDNSKIIKFR